MAEEKADEKALKKEAEKQEKAEVKKTVKAQAKESKDVKKEKKTAEKKPKTAVKEKKIAAERPEAKAKAKDKATSAAKTSVSTADTTEAKTADTGQKRAARGQGAKKKAKAKREEYWATGRRKESVARLRLIPGQGSFELNGRSLEEYFGRKALQHQVKKPLNATKTLGKFDVFVNINGGGTTGQAEAIQLGVARALAEYDETFRETLKKIGLLTRDSREKERRKYSLEKNRQAAPASKREV